MLWWSVATAAQIQVLVSTPVQIQIDGTFVETLSGAGTVRDLEAGEHTVRVLDLMSRPVVTQTITLAADDLVVLRYKPRFLTEESRGKIAGSTPTIAPTATIAGPALDVLVQHVRGAKTFETRLALVAYAATTAKFSVDQAQVLMSIFSTDAEKVEVVRALRPSLSDPERSAALVSAVGAASQAAMQALF